MPLASRSAADALARRLDAGTPVPGDPAVALALQLRATGAALRGAVVPRPEFRAALRTRLVAVASVQAATAADAVAEPVNARHAAASWRAASRAPRRSRGPLVAAGALASVVAVSGVAVAGSQSLPGEPFYGVKTATESVQLRLAGDDVATGDLHLDLAATRLREIRALTLGRDAALPVASVGGGQPLALAAPVLAGDLDEEVRDTLARMDASTREGTGLLTGAFRETRATEPLRTLSRFAERQSAGLAELLPSLPSGSQERARASLALVTGVAEQADALLATGACTAVCDPSAAAPQLPGSPTGSGPTTQECGCPSPAPAPSAVPSSPLPLPLPPPGTEPVEPGAVEPTEGPGTPAPADPAPSPSPTSSTGPLPVPLPLPPLPLPTLPLPTVQPLPLPLPSSLGGVVGDTVDELEDVVGGVLDPLLP